MPSATLLIILFIAFATVTLIQLCYYLFIFARFSFENSGKPTQDNTPPVSVIVCAKNEAANLKAFIPKILQQNYPVFELVLVNDSSSDDTWEIMEYFKEQFPEKVTLVNVTLNENFVGNKKYALTLGIKTAKYAHLLFTDADCLPNSCNWITAMVAPIVGRKEISLGYGAYQKDKASLLNKLIRFETLLTAIQYFSYAKIGIPYMGVGRNLFYKKSLFNRNNGFVNHMKIRSGDDDLFINEVAHKYNTALVFSKDSFTISVPKKSWASWFRQKRRHVSTANLYKKKHQLLLGLFYSTQLFFWTLGIACIVLSPYLYWVLAIILIRMLAQYMVFGFAAKKLKEQDLLYFLPLLEPLLILSQFLIFIINTISRPKHWN